MAEIPEADKLSIKMMAEYLYEISPIRFAWTQKFLTVDYLKPVPNEDDFELDGFEEEYLESNRIAEQDLIDMIAADMMRE